MARIVCFALFLGSGLIAAGAFAQELVLSGTSSKVIAIDQFGNRITHENDHSRALRITRIGDDYFWASRGDIPLAVTASGIYLTYIAVDGSGYIRTVNETARQRFLEQGPDNIIGRYTYVEHVSHDLTSTTAYGR